MKILVYGAGPLGSLFAARLHQGGHQVALLARGRCLAELQAHGIVLEDASTEERTTTVVDLVEHLAPHDSYDLVLVIMRKNKVAEVLPILAAKPHVPSVLFMMNNAAGPGEFIRDLGPERVLLGFPASAGCRKDYAIRYLGGTPQHKVTIPIGEADGTIIPRTKMVAQALRDMPGYDVEIRRDMDAWLKTHVALLMPALAPALYAASTDNYRLAHTRDLLVLAARGMREAFRVLHALQLPITPPNLRLLEVIPEPVLVALLSRLLQRKEMEVALVGHAQAARDEVHCLADEFLALARATPVTTTDIDYLYTFLDPAASPVPEGQTELPLDWRSVWGSVATAVGLLGGLFAVTRGGPKSGRWAHR